MTTILSIWNDPLLSNVAVLSVFVLKSCDGLNRGDREIKGRKVTRWSGERGQGSKLTAVILPEKDCFCYARIVVVASSRYDQNCWLGREI